MVEQKHYVAVYENAKITISDPPRFPDNNCKSVVKAKRKQRLFKYLLLMGGSVDISNLRTNFE